MLTGTSRWILAGAWTLIAAAGALGLRGIARIPAQDTEADATLRAFQAKRAGAPVETPPPLKAPPTWNYVAPEPAPLSAHAATLRPRMQAEARQKPPVDVPVMPFYATAVATASLDGAALSWTRVRGRVELERHERPKDVMPAAVTVERRTADGWKVVARLKPDATSWTDVEAPFGAALAYRVRMAAPEAAKATADVGADAETRTPSNTRARLVGGDAKVALLRVETYNRTSRTWSGKERPVRPGEAIWPGGWTLVGLKFRGFGLVAEAAVGDGRTVELTTQD
jgi:hypothetical protein